MQITTEKTTFGLRECLVILLSPIKTRHSVMEDMKIIHGHSENPRMETRVFHLWTAWPSIYIFDHGIYLSQVYDTKWSENTPRHIRSQHQLIASMSVTDWYFIGQKTENNPCLLRGVYSIRSTGCGKRNSRWEVAIRIQWGTDERISATGALTAAAGALTWENVQMSL
jgi:hypothetical protein